MIGDFTPSKVFNQSLSNIYQAIPRTLIEPLKIQKSLREQKFQNFLPPPFVPPIGEPIAPPLEISVNPGVPEKKIPIKIPEPPGIPSYGLFCIFIPNGYVKQYGEFIRVYTDSGTFTYDQYPEFSYREESICIVEASNVKRTDSTYGAIYKCRYTLKHQTGNHLSKGIDIDVDVIIDCKIYYSNSGDTLRPMNEEDGISFSFRCSIWRFYDEMESQLRNMGYSYGHLEISSGESTILSLSPFGNFLISTPYHDAEWLLTEIIPGINGILCKYSGISTNIDETYSQAYCFTEKGLPPPPPPPILPPSPPKECSMCCPQNYQVLQLLLRRLGKFPDVVPDKFTTKKGVQPGSKSIQSLAELIGWFAERFDEVLGEFEIVVDIKDADLIKEGEQKQTIRLPNLAEAIAEMFVMNFQTMTRTELILQIVNRCLIEEGQNKQTSVKNHAILNTLVEYLGFPTTTVIEKIPLSYSVNTAKFDELLKPSEINCSVLDFQEKANFSNALQTLLQAAAIIRAVHYRKLSDNKTTMKQELKSDLKKLLSDSGDLNKNIEKFISEIQL